METLLLSAAFEPIRTISWYEAFEQVLKGSAELVEHYEEAPIRSGIGSIGGVTSAVNALRIGEVEGAILYKRPLVIRQKKIYKRRKVVRFSRENVWLRDNGKCQYCGIQCARYSFTYDHVIPRAKGGKTVWENVVVSCAPCNQKKGGRTPKEAKMHLISEPHTPKALPGFYRRALKWETGMHEKWGWYLGSDAYWNVELESDSK
jgi:5-methylcytosine-specific restriction endonuclease McrA